MMIAEAGRKKLRTIHPAVFGNTLCWQRIGKLLDLFPPGECAYFFVNSGYAGSLAEPTEHVFLEWARVKFGPCPIRRAA